jgi:hypothetical protein
MSLVARYLFDVALIAFVTTSALAAPGDLTRAKLLDLRLVGGQATCSTAALPHAAPMALPSCVPSPLSATKSFGPVGRGRVRLRVSSNTAAEGVPPTLDFKVAVDMRDVRDRGTPIASGFLTVSIPVQAIGPGCSGASCPSAVRLPVSVPCGASGGWPPGQCRIRTLFNATVPGVVVGASGANVEVGQVQVVDGPDVVFVQAP